MPCKFPPTRLEDNRCSRALRSLADTVGPDHADPMNFSADIDIGDTSFSLRDRIDLLGVDSLSALADKGQSRRHRVSARWVQPAMTINGARR
jgi:hypothetical protein